jgi:HD-GYP domain-containing protein (c-di-GMP phosphodiesterase class II)/ABC-type amino acid transport substrate-binding protein
VKKIVFIFILIITTLNVFSIKIGIYENPPYVINESEGIIVELLNYIEKNYNLDLELVMGNQPGLIEKLKSGEIDAVSPLGETEERKQFGIFNKSYFFTEWGIIYTKDNLSISTFQELEGKTIAVMDTDIYYEGEYGLKNILDNFGIHAYFIEYGSYKEVLKSVEENINDVAVVNRLYDISGYNNLRRSNILFSPIVFKILFRKDLPEVQSIISTFDKALTDLINNKNSIYYEILDKYTVSQQTVLPDSFVRNLIIFLTILFLVILGLYLLIIIMRKTIRNKKREADKLNKKLFQMIDLVSKIGSGDIDIDEFYSDLLEGTINLIDEAKTGSISIFDHNKWIYLSTYGHDKEKLMEKGLKKDYRLPVNGTEIFSFEEIINMNQKLMSEQIRKNFEKYTKPFKQMMISRVKINENTSMDFSVEIPEEPDEKFSEESKIIFKSLVSLSKAFMSNQINLNIARSAYVKFAKKLSKVAEEFDDETGGHIQRVGELSAFIAEKLGMSPNYVKEIREFAPLHDMGKIFIPKEILKKPGKLTNEEWKIVKKHTSFSYKLLGEEEYFAMALNISLYHHEKYCGGGYPFNISGDKIPLEAQIVSIVDVYDALRSKRSYKPNFSHEKAMDIILNGDQRTKPEDFNPKVLNIFKKYSEEIKELYDKF